MAITFINPYINALPIAVFELDAGLSTSYDGSSQAWKNIVTSPADGQSQSYYDFILGANNSSASDDPVFNGSAGNDSANEYFSANTTSQYFFSNISSTFIDNLHRDDTVYTWYGFIQTPNSFSNSWSWFCTNRNSPINRGLMIGIDTSGKLFWKARHTSSFSTTLTSSSITLSTSTKYFIAVAYTESTGATVFYKHDGVTRTVENLTQQYTAAADGSAFSNATMLVDGASIPSLERVWRTGMFNIALQASQLDTLYNRYKAKLGF